METVILLHGVWMSGAELVVLKRRLKREHGFSVRIFSYSSIGAGLEENAHRLRDFVASSRGERVHLVGHSLGGVLMLRMMARHRVNDRPGRLVCLGSPLQGSRVARMFAGIPWFGRHLLGRTLVDGVLEGGALSWRGEREVGVVAGSLNMGLGTFAGVTGPSDGTVAVSETWLPGAADHIVLPVSHMSMLFAPEVAAHVNVFLREGRFVPPVGTAAADG